MKLNDDNMDLRMLSLLHVLRDKEGFLQEIRRLGESGLLDDESWPTIHEMSTELELEAGSLIPRVSTGRRQQERRWRSRRMGEDRRQQERRTITLPWLGTERRKCERRP